MSNVSNHTPWRYLAGFVLLTTLLTWLSWNTNAPSMGLVLTHASDPLGYYQYLPGLFMQGDLSTLPYVHYLPNGNGLSMFTMGIAVLQAPFFLLAWLYCTIANIPATGFELPFVFARLLASSAYMAGGITLVLHMLLQRHARITAWVSTGALLFGTTLYYYTVREGGMSHAYSFFLITWAVFLTYRMLEQSRWDRLLALFFCMSLVILIRPLNGVVGLFVLFAGAPPLAALRIRLQWLRSQPIATLAGVLLALCIWVPQLFYWKMQTGSWFVFTYGRKEERFDFTDPHLVETLFSFQNGWFAYTPLMLFVFGMLLWNAWRGIVDARLTLLVWGMVWYVYASWWCWWLGSAFGYRGFLELYGLLAFPLAALLERVLRTSWQRFVTVLILLVIVRLNIRLGHIYQYPWEAPHWDWAKLGNAYLKALLW